jgi:RNA polymerase sigma-70 factor (ECF subfamily)
LYEEAAGTYGHALERLARAYEADPDRRNDILQELHLALWKSFGTFEGRCSMRTWVYRVAYNAAMAYIVRQTRMNSKLTGLEEVDAVEESDLAEEVERRIALDGLYELIQALRPLDRQIMILYLEDMEAPEIAEVTGISPGHVRTQIYRIKRILTRRLQGGQNHA